MKPHLLVALLAACGGTEPQPEPARLPATIVGKTHEGQELIGTPAPPLDGVEWLDGKPHPLLEDRGKVVLVRWWTDTCPFCANSAPAIAALTRKHGDRLLVRAVYHNKMRGRRVDAIMLKRMAKKIGFDQLVGTDEGWERLNAWWLSGGRRRFTSVTFVLGKKGHIRLIHTGGEFHSRDTGDCLDDPERCHAEFEAIDRAIGVLAAE